MQKIINIASLFIIFSVLVYRTVATINQGDMSILCFKNDKMKEKYFHSVISNKFIDKRQSSSKVYELSNNQVFSLANSFFSDFYEKVEIGDSISKKKGDLHLEIHKKDTIILYKLNYGCPNDLDGNGASENE